MRRNVPQTCHQPRRRHTHSVRRLRYIAAGTITPSRDASTSKSQACQKRALANTSLIGGPIESGTACQESETIPQTWRMSVRGGTYFTPKSRPGAAAGPVLGGPSESVSNSYVGVGRVRTRPTLRVAQAKALNRVSNQRVTCVEEAVQGRAAVVELLGDRHQVAEQHSRRAVTKLSD